MRLTRAVVLMTCLLLTTCKSAPVLVAEPSVSQGLEIELTGHEYDQEDMDLQLVATNQTQDNIVIDRDQIALVLPNGQELERGGGGMFDGLRRATTSQYLVIRAGASDRFSLHFSSDDFDFEDAEGYWLRFDGIYVGDSRLPVPPMALAKPTHEAGRAREYPIPQRARDAYTEGADHDDRDESVIGSIARVVTGVVARSPRRAQAAEEAKGLEQYRGHRAKLKTQLKAAAMPLKTSGVPENVTLVMDELLLTELQTVGFEAIGPDDIDAMIGHEVMKEEAGCDDASCVAEIGNALGVPFLTAGSVAEVEGTLVLTLKLIDVTRSTVVARASKIAEGGSRVFPRVIAETVQELVRNSGL